jgi:hypothetical protein
MISAATLSMSRVRAGCIDQTAAEQLMLHKNTVQYQALKAKVSLGPRVDENRYEVELALQASRWLGSSVLQPAAAGHDPRERAH